MRGTVRALTREDVRDLAGGFVLDALDTDEMDAMRAHLADCADPHPEIAELASGLPRSGRRRRSWSRPRR